MCSGLGSGTCDEKKWNCDGPDGLSSYWHDLRKEKRMFKKRGFGGGSLITWGAITKFGRLALVFVDGRMNSEAYQKLLTDNLLPLLHKFHRFKWLFQQDNASIHSSASTKRWFKENNVNVLDWPARSPDLNIIENVWGILARDVYENARQFDNVKLLREAIEALELE
uniref:Tc1-like transposase DDE domain-containing protein n=2 Tax=Meloidogyne TaxID=189290 RepID=A0A6V7V320_MELEN|nr:unnamed protein product [Meloidogyne enterolobii]